MIRKPKRINVRFSEREYAELQELWKMAGVYDWTSFTRKAFANYRRFLFEQQQRIDDLNPTANRQTMPALSDKDKRQSKSKPAAKSKTKATAKA